MREDKISSAATAPEFPFTLARVAVAQICQSIGYSGAQRRALDTLTDIATRYLKAAARLSAESANSNGRTQSNLFDIIAALENLASVQGFEGSSRVRSRSLLKSAVVKDLMKSVKYTDKIPFAQALPPKRSCTERDRVSRNRDEGGWYNEGNLKHVPRWLPAVQGSEEAVVERREGKLEWGCSDGGAKMEEVNMRRECGEAKKKRECNELRVRREKVRFKMGNCKPGRRRSQRSDDEFRFFLKNAGFEVQQV